MTKGWCGLRDTHCSSEHHSIRQIFGQLAQTHDYQQGIERLLFGTLLVTEIHIAIACRFGITDRRAMKASAW